MTLLTDLAERTEQGVHALVIGVGKYPFMGPGSNNAAPWLSKFGDIDSPPISAALFSEWLIKTMKVDALPLRSLEVLASSPTQCLASDGSLQLVEEPTIDNIQAAAGRWFSAANSHPENMSIFYFCGHGLTVGEVHALLAQDFGSNVDDPSQFAIDPDRLAAGMLRCAAERQLFIFDACSTQDFDLLEEFGDIKPRPLIAGKRHNRLQLVERSIIRTSRLGAEAYGTTNPPGPSVFMAAFLLATQGAGAAQDDLAAWVIEPTALKRGVDLLMRRMLKRETQCVTFGSSDSSDFPLHQLDGNPIVPVMVVCKPEYRLAESILSCSSGAARSDAVGEPWHLDLPLGAYTFSARNVNDGTVRSSPPRENWPPRLVVRIDC